MDEGFRKLLLEAEKIRRDIFSSGRREIASHALHMAKMIEYGMSKNLLTGKVLESTASEENLAQAAEIAAFILQTSYGEFVESVIELPDDRKFQIIKASQAIAEFNLAAEKHKSHI